MKKNVVIYCGSRYGNNPAFSALAGMIGEYLGKNGYTLIYGGGSIGLMGVAADAAMAAGGEVIGIIPEVFIAREQAHRSITKLIEVKNMTERKEKMIASGDIFLVLPGGIGTMEEFFDTINHFYIYKNTEEQPNVIIADIEGIYRPLEKLFQNWKDFEFVDPQEWMSSIRIYIHWKPA